VRCASDTGERPSAELVAPSEAKPQATDMVGGRSACGAWARRPISIAAASVEEAHLGETQALRWATLGEARKLVAETTNQTGQKRDLAVLRALENLLSKR
jgi:hypothetical protein